MILLEEHSESFRITLCFHTLRTGIGTAQMIA